MGHRLLKDSWAGMTFVRGHREVSPAPETLAAVAALCNERERAAAQTEREVHAYFRALFMQDKVGQRFAGTVSSIAPFGVFVELERWPVEGLIRREELGEDFELDGECCALVQPRTGRAFRVGDPVQVEVHGVSPARRQMDLILAGSKGDDAPKDGVR